MKKIMMLLLTIISFISLSGCNKEEKPDIPDEPITEPANEVNIIVLCGQSNAEGHTWWIQMENKNSQLFNKYIKREDSYLKMLYNCDGGRHSNDEFESVKFGMGYDKNRFGPEIGMNEVLENTNLTRETYILKYTVGATDLYYQWRSPSSGSAGNLYNGMTLYLYEQLEALIEQGKVPYIKAICFMQGEADSQIETKTNSYETYLDNFINDLNNDLADYIEETDETIKFIDAGISESSAWTYYEKVNQAKKNVQLKDADNRAFIDTIGLGLDFRTEPVGGPDLYHYDSLSMVELGKKFAEAIVGFNVLK